MNKRRSLAMRCCNVMRNKNGGLERLSSPQPPKEFGELSTAPTARLVCTSTSLQAACLFDPGSWGEANSGVVRPLLAKLLIAVRRQHIGQAARLAAHSNVPFDFAVNQRLRNLIAIV